MVTCILAVAALWLLAHPCATSDSLSAVEVDTSLEQEPEYEEYTAPSPLIVNEFRLQKFGRAKYPDSKPLLTWDELSVHSRLGAACDAGYDATKQCGRGLVCRQSLCRRCTTDAECPSLHTCIKEMGRERMCVENERKVWETVWSDPWEGLCTLLIFCASTIAAAAGTGGGGIFVPLLISMSHLKAESAVPLSQCMILCGSVVNLAVVLAKQHPEFHNLPLIDYDCVLLFEPLLCMGVTLGVLVNLMAPQWLLFTLLCITMGLAFWRTLGKGIKQFREERKAKPRAAESELPAKLYSESFLELTNMKAWQVVGIVLVWVLILLSSFHGLNVCTAPFAGFLAVLAVLLAGFSVVAARFIASNAERAPIDWVSGGGLCFNMQFPLIAFGAGLLSGLLGVGGGSILGPILLEVGMHSEAVQATTATFVFLSSSIATIQFAVLSQHVWHYALWYSAVSVLATLLGQVLCEVFVRKGKHYSMVTLSIALILFASLVPMSILGVRSLIEDVRFGRRMWFSMVRLCESGVGIVAVDVYPAQPWPSDLPLLGG